MPDRDGRPNPATGPEQPGPAGQPRAVPAAPRGQQRPAGNVGNAAPTSGRPVGQQPNAEPRGPYGGQQGQQTYPSPYPPVPRRASGPVSHGGYAPGVGVAPQGAPQGAPAPGLFRKPSRTAPLVLGILALVAVVAAVVVVVRPSTVRSEKVLDHAAVQRTIEQQSNGALTDVSCPAGKQVKAGTTFRCTTADGQQVAVLIEDGAGDYVWVLSGQKSQVTP